MNKLFRPAFSCIALTIAFVIWTAAPLHAQVSTWSGGSLANSNWDQSANWQSGAIPDGNTDMTFTGSLQTTNNNNFSENQISLNFLDFDSGADAFTLQGSACQFTHPGGTNTITNHSTNLQTLDFDAAMTVQVAVTIDAVSGDILINNGLFLQAFQTNSADLTVTGSHDTTLAGVISEDTNLNPAALIKDGTGTLFLLNDNTYSGGTTIDGGTIAVGSLNALGTGDVFVHGSTSDATLQTAGSTILTFNAGDANHDFTLDGGTPLTILRMKVGGTSGAINSDLMQVGRDAFLDVNGGSILFVHRIDNVMPSVGDRTTIITTGGTVNGTFGEVQTDFPGLIQPMADYFADHVDVVFDLSASFASQALTRNQLCVGENLDAAAGLSSQAAINLVTIIGNQPVAELPAIFDLLAPEELASIYEISFQHGIMEMTNYRNRMSDLRAEVRGYCEVEAAPQPMEMRPDGKTVLDGKQDKNPVVETCPDKRYGMFATGYGQGVSVGDDDSNEVHGYDIMTGGFSTGFDALVTHNFAVGIGGGYASSSADLVNDGRVNVETTYVAGYATWFSGGFYVDGAASFGWNSIDTKRLGFGGFEDGATDGAEFNGIIGGGYDWKTHCWTIGPFATFHYTYVEFDGFDEHGNSVAPLHFPDQNQDAERGSVGLKVAYDMTRGNIIFRPEVRAAFQHEFNSTDYSIAWSFRDITDEHICDVFGPSTGQDSALIDAGFSLILGKCHDVSAFAFYSGNIGRENDTRHGVTGGLRLAF